jgi:DNA-binding winged helix-turn-helix (wHTH) protein
MEQITSTNRMVRFGVFELDLSAGELRKNGRRLKLQEQPFQVLASLLERPGHVVTREQLRQRLWAADTYVDFDRSLNSAVNRLRETLEDSAQEPRFVETLPRRGYRFVGRLEPTCEQNQQMLRITRPLNGFVERASGNGH